MVGFGKSVCHEALLFIRNVSGMTASNYYLCLEATVLESRGLTVKSLAIVISEGGVP